ncbi:MAG: hypothetical protein [Circular genetic element sp.]|nr:MAG: hypothetical protein [Circular genetic element sp.]
MLRGTKRKQATNAAWSQRQTIQNQITALKVQVSKNKPETQYYRSTATVSSATTGNEITTIPVTSNLIASSNFRDTVTGDKWANLRLSLDTYVSADVSHMRVLIYVPKKAGNRFDPSGGTMFVSHPDKSAFWVLSDKLITLDRGYGSDSGFTACKSSANFQGLHTLYNSDSATLEQGEIVVAFMHNGTTALAEQFVYGLELSYQNK